jgi:hypothetical protein
MMSFKLGLPAEFQFPSNVKLGFSDGLICPKEYIQFVKVKQSNKNILKCNEASFCM